MVPSGQGSTFTIMSFFTGFSIIALIRTPTIFFFNKTIQSVSLSACPLLCHLLHTFPHEGSFLVVHYLCRDQSIIDHSVVFHAAEAAVFGTVVDLVLRQGTLQERAQFRNGAV